MRPMRFFANDILVHNTDSAYFSAYSSLKNEINKGEIPWTKDTVVQLYDTIAEEVNSTFPQYMLDAYHCPKSRGEVIRAGREIVAIKGLFITKKRYAVLYYDKEGKRSDIDGKSGKIKAMGLDLKRSDTPEFMQKFLEEVLTKVLNGSEEREILDMISEFRTEFKVRPGWEKGSPKRANNIAEYQEKERKAGKANLPGHVRAAINWNTLKRMNNDKYSQQIVDGNAREIPPAKTPPGNPTLPRAAPSAQPLPPSILAFRLRSFPSHCAECCPPQGSCAGPARPHPRRRSHPTAHLHHLQRPR